MKEILGKYNTKFSNLSTKMTLNKTDIFDVKKQLMNTIIFPKHWNIIFDFYTTEADNSMESQPLSFSELKNAFFFT